MIYWTNPFVTGESPQVTVYNSTEEERSLDEVSMAAYSCRSASVCFRGGSSYPTASFRQLSGSERM